MPDPQQGQGGGYSGNLMQQAIDKILKTLKADEFLSLTQGQPEGTQVLRQRTEQRGQDYGDMPRWEQKARALGIRQQPADPNWMENMMQQQGRFPRGGMGGGGLPVDMSMPTTDPWIATRPQSLAQEEMARQRAAAAVAREQAGGFASGGPVFPAFTTGAIGKYTQEGMGGMPQGMDRERIMQAIQQMIESGGR